MAHARPAATPPRKRATKISGRLVDSQCAIDFAGAGAAKARAQLEARLHFGGDIACRLGGVGRSSGAVGGGSGGRGHGRGKQALRAGGGCAALFRAKVSVVRVSGFASGTKFHRASKICVTPRELEGQRNIGNAGPQVRAETPRGRRSGRILVLPCAKINECHNVAPLAGRTTLWATPLTGTYQPRGTTFE